MNYNELLELLKSRRACSDAIGWVRTNGYTLEQAWINCHRGDWMLWFASIMRIDKRKLTLAKGLCAKTVIHLMEDKRSIDAVKAAIAYGKGEIDDNRLTNASAAADTVAAAYAADAATAYASAAAYVAAAYAADAADAAAYAAYADAAAYAAYADAARIENQQKTADICREILTDKILTASGQLKIEISCQNSEKI